MIKRRKHPARRLGRVDDAPGLRVDGRHNHKPKAEYCSGVTFDGEGWSEAQFDEGLALMNDPRTPLSQQFQTAFSVEVYRRMALIRAARSTRETVEDRKQPVDVTVIPASEVFSHKGKTWT